MFVALGVRGKTKMPKRKTKSICYALCEKQSLRDKKVSDEECLLRMVFEKQSV